MDYPFLRISQILIICFTNENYRRLGKIEFNNVVESTVASADLRAHLLCLRLERMISSWIIHFGGLTRLWSSFLPMKIIGGLMMTCKTL